MRWTTGMEFWIRWYNQPKYTSEHCNEEYAIYIDTVKVEIMASKQGDDEEKVISLQEEPRAIRMANGRKLEEREKNDGR